MGIWEILRPDSQSPCQPPLVASYDTHGEEKNGGPILPARAHKGCELMWLFMEMENADYFSNASTLVQTQYFSGLCFYHMRNFSKKCVRWANSKIHILQIFYEYSRIVANIKIIEILRFSTNISTIFKQIFMTYLLYKTYNFMNLFRFRYRCYEIPWTRFAFGIFCNSCFLCWNVDIFFENF
jgi:hypothetical protein